MNTNRRAIAALATAGLLWGTSVPLSKLALGWLAPGWLTVARFGMAAAILLLAAPRAGLRAACRPLVLASGAFGYGGSVIVQNAGIARTSVTHAALLVGAVPVLVAVIAAVWQRSVAPPVAWSGFRGIAGWRRPDHRRPGRRRLPGGDALVLVSLLLSATFTVGQVRLLRGQDPIAVTAVQFLGAALAVLPFSAVAEGLPAAPHGAGTVLAVVALAAGGTLLPFTLFAYGQSRVSAELAGAFVNLEPLVGAVAGVALFGNPAGPVQAAGGAAIIAGIAMSSLPLLRPRRRRLGYCKPRAGSDVERELGQTADAAPAAVAGPAPAGRGSACRRPSWPTRRSPPCWAPSSTPWGTPSPSTASRGGTGWPSSPGPAWTAW